VATRKAPPICAICGADIPATARACPECGADERTGWDEQSAADGLDLPEEESTSEAHARYLRDEALPGRPQGRRDWFWWAVGVVVLLALLAPYVLGLL
jgi:hypothetical protein